MVFSLFTRHFCIQILQGSLLYCSAGSVTQGNPLSSLRTSGILPFLRNAGCFSSMRCLRLALSRQSSPILWLNCWQGFISIAIKLQRVAHQNSLELSRRKGEATKTVSSMRSPSAPPLLSKTALQASQMVLQRLGQTYSRGAMRAGLQAKKSSFLWRLWASWSYISRRSCWSEMQESELFWKILYSQKSLRKLRAKKSRGSLRQYFSAELLSLDSKALTSQMTTPLRNSRSLHSCDSHCRLNTKAVSSLCWKTVTRLRKGSQASPRNSRSSSQSRPSRLSTRTSSNLAVLVRKWSRKAQRRSFLSRWWKQANSQSSFSLSVLVPKATVSSSCPARSTVSSSEEKRLWKSELLARNCRETNRSSTCSMILTRFFFMPRLLRRSCMAPRVINAQQKIQSLLQLVALEVRPLPVRARPRRQYLVLVLRSEGEADVAADGDALAGVLARLERVDAGLDVRAGVLVDDVAVELLLAVPAQELGEAVAGAALLPPPLDRRRLLLRLVVAALGHRLPLLARLSLGLPVAPLPAFAERVVPYHHLSYCLGLEDQAGAEEGLLGLRVELPAAEDDPAQHLLLPACGAVELQVEVLALVDVGEEEAVALPEERAGVADGRSFVVVLVGDVDLEELVAERALEVADADGGDLVVELAGGQLGGRLDGLRGVLGVVRVVDHAVSHRCHLLLRAALLLPPLAGLVVDRLELLQQGTGSLLGGRSGHEGGLHDVVDGHALGVDAVRLPPPLRLRLFGDDGLRPQALLPLAEDVRLLLLDHLLQQVLVGCLVASYRHFLRVVAYLVGLAYVAMRDSSPVGLFCWSLLGWLGGCGYFGPAVFLLAEGVVDEERLEGRSCVDGLPVGLLVALLLLAGVRVLQASLLLVVDALLLLVNDCLVLGVLGELLLGESLGLLAQISPDSLQLLYLFVQLAALGRLIRYPHFGQLLVFV